jgi:peptide/nickel transport system substrate-binding protein
MIKCNAVWNEAHYCDDELDKLIETAGTTLNEEERVQAYKDIQRILIERAPFIITSFWAMNAAISNGFDGFEPKAFAGRTDLREVSVSQ